MDILEMEPTVKVSNIVVAQEMATIHKYIKALWTQF